MKFPIKYITSLLLCGLCISCTSDYKSLDGMIWNTSYHVIYQSGQNLTDSIYDVLESVGNSLNVFDEASLVSRLNHTDSLNVDRHFIRVYNASRKINELSNGAFDPTLGPLIRVWGFEKGHTATCDTLRLDSLLKLTGINRTELKGSIILKENPEIQFNFSAIAKGYGCDAIAEMLERNGVSSYLIEIGGEIRCNGHNPENGKWRISIDRPVLSDSVLHESQCIVEVESAGIATSGNYRNFKRVKTGIYGHTISTETGRPVQTDILSATVVADDAMTADGLATAMMAIGSKKAAELAETTNTAALLILADGNVWQNKAFKKLLSH